jgi:hypothetical protein
MSIVDDSKYRSFRGGGGRPTVGGGIVVRLNGGGTRTRGRSRTRGGGRRSGGSRSTDRADEEGGGKCDGGHAS